jgi:hypothetical protein
LQLCCCQFAYKLIFTFILFTSPFIVIVIVDQQQKSYTKKGRARAAAAKLKQANGNTNGHITHDINHNETKPIEEKKDK